MTEICCYYSYSERYRRKNNVKDYALVIGINNKNIIKKTVYFSSFRDVDNKLVLILNKNIKILLKINILKGNKAGVPISST